MSECRTVWGNSCFRIEDEDGALWVTELLHTRRGDVPKRWRIRFSTVESARLLIASRLREGHERMYHFHAEARTVAG